MPRVCTICSHPQRPDIDRAILAGAVSIRDIARQYRVSKDALHRHKNDHLPGQMVQVAERNAEADVRTAIDVVAQLKEINGVALDVLKEARDAGDGELALKAVDRIQKQIELQAKLIDLINDGNTVNIIVNPQWLQLRTIILTTLQNHPEARNALAEALRAVEGGKQHDRVA